MEYLYNVHVDVFTDHKSLKYVFDQKDLNLHQIRWLELLKDYNMSVLYHSEKVNMIAGSLNRLPMESVDNVEDDKNELVYGMYRLSQLCFHLVDSNEWDVVTHNGFESSLVSDVKVK